MSKNSASSKPRPLRSVHIVMWRWVIWSTRLKSYPSASVRVHVGHHLNLSELSPHPWDADAGLGLGYAL